MSTAALSKVRSRRRSTQAGAVMFILAMTLAVLASLGLYAMKAASTEIKTSGYARASAQSQYMAEYGVLSSTQTLSGTLGQMQFGAAISTADRDTLCVSLTGIDLVKAGFRSQACRRVSGKELQNMLWNGQSITPVDPYKPGVATGSLGPFPNAGDYFVEITDPSCAYQAPGYSGGNFWFTDTTLTAYGRTEPDAVALASMGISTLPESVLADQNLQISRAHIIAGPYGNTACGTAQ
jgi:hypothetical protein